MVAAVGGTNPSQLEELEMMNQMVSQQSNWKHQVIILVIRGSKCLLYMQELPQPAPWVQVKHPKH